MLNTNISFYCCKIIGLNHPLVCNHENKIVHKNIGVNITSSSFQ